jgi:BirA family biotin operon repressor/biotin-[acetyl-CoA-carboxylase] ligase
LSFYPTSASDITKPTQELRRYNRHRDFILTTADIPDYTALIQLIRLLADNQWHTDTWLAKQMKTTIVNIRDWHRQIEPLFHITIDHHDQYGYRLTQSIDFLNHDTVLSHLPVSIKSVLGELHIFDWLDSTNRWLMTQAQQGISTGTICCAEYQTAGKGRLGRTWVSPLGTNLALSLLWRSHQQPNYFSGLSLAAGVTVATVLTQLGATDIVVKWPNDLHWRGHKIAGLLLEVAKDRTGASTVVLGLGINLRLNEHQAQSIKQPWTDLQTLLNGCIPERNQLVAVISAHLLNLMQLYSQQGLQAFLATWDHFDCYRGQTISIQDGHHQRTGRYLGINEQGALQLEDQAGQILQIHSGDVTILSNPSSSP